MASNLVIHIDPLAIRRVLQTDPRYELMARSIGEKIRASAISIFEIEEIKNNQGRISENTPPKYISSFRVDFYKDRLKMRVANTDPGWWLVEFGSHPGGNPRARVRPYKPLSRAFTIAIVSRGRA